MTLIKASQDTLAQVRPFRASPLAGAGVVEAPKRDRDLERLEAQVAALTAEIAHAREEAASLRGAADQAYLDGELAGREAGRLLAETREAERLAAIREAADTARAAFKQAVADLESLAILMTRTALEKVLGDPGEYPALTARIVHRQAAALRGGCKVCVQVSSEDFAPGALSEAFAGAGWLQATALDDLSPGACRLKLTLGELDLSVSRQWGALKDLLDEMANEERRG